MLVLWSGFPASEATWEPVPEFRATYPDFQLEDELFPKEGRDVMTGQVYERRRREHGRRRTNKTWHPDARSSSVSLLDRVYKAVVRRVIYLC